MDPFSIYIHLPFCATKCRYCDFGTRVAPTIPFERYGAAVIRELEARLAIADGMELRSVYIGGGTPSLWPARDLARMISACRPGRDAEVTVEVNPGDADRDWFAAMIDAGATRFSVGAQAMDDGRLEWMGRRHDARAAAEALALAVGSGARSVSADIIYGTPGHTSRVFGRELERLCDAGIHHVSAYELTVGQNTEIGRMAAAGALVLPDEDRLIELWDTAGDTLSGRGLGRYEVSSYAMAGHESAHNRHYWRGGVYLGVGAGAHGHAVVDGERIRWCNVVDPERYMAGEDAEIERLSALDRARELVMLAMRCVDGFDSEAVAAGLAAPSAKHWRGILADLISKGLATREGSRLVPTRAGMLTADDVAGLFF